MPDSKVQFDSVRAVIRLRVRSRLRSKPIIVLPPALATGSATLSPAFASTWTLFPTLSSRSIAPRNRRSRLLRAKAIYCLIS